MMPHASYIANGFAGYEALIVLLLSQLFICNLLVSGFVGG